jgi:hypothetical protein
VTSDANAGTSPSAARIVADAMGAYERGDLAALKRFIHPDAEIEMVLLEQEAARGPEEVEAVLTQARKRVHRPTVSRIEEIAEDAVVMIGRIQFDDARGGLSDRKAVWLTVVRDGKLWRTRVVRSLADARAAYRQIVAG